MLNHILLYKLHIFVFVVDAGYITFFFSLRIEVVFDLQILT